MKMIYAGVISTALVLIFGIALVIPAYFQVDTNGSKAMLIFSVTDSDGAQDWFYNLSTILQKTGVPATIFVSGEFASAHPECITSLADNIDIGSQTYSYVKLTGVSDYLHQLEEIMKGKEAVDAAGRLDSRLFMAPFRATDDNIYSLLNRSGILADFSYTDHYNKFHNGQFIKFEIESCNGSKFSTDYILQNKASGLIMIYFEAFTPIARISELLTSLKSAKWQFFNASEITGLTLTVRREKET